MKSIMEEASSVAKAIEKGWIRAGKPQEFTVKVFEEAQKNFIGLTTKSAKVGLFFEESSRANTNKNTDSRRMADRSADNKQQRPKQQPDRNQKPQHSQEKSMHDRQRQQSGQDKSLDRARFDKPVERQPFAKQDQPQGQRDQSSSPWSTELVDTAQDWLKGSLATLGQGNLQFSAEVERYALRVTFPKLITQSSEKEKMLFRSWAYLLMQALRQKYKRPLKGLKVILMSNT